MESGPAPTPTTTEPGRTTVQLLVASSAVLALLQLVAATSVDVYNGQRAGWWIAIQGTTVAFAAAFAGAAAGSNGAWWRRLQEKSGSTTPSSLGTGVASAAVAGAVFSVLCWAASSLGDASSPMGVGVLIAALLGGVAGSARIGGAVLAGLVATFVATLVNLTGQSLAKMFVLAPAVSPTHDGSLTFSAVTWAISSIAGAMSGVWWLTRRRQRTGISHALIIGIFPAILLAVGSVGSLVAWALVSDPAKDEALDQAVGAHGLELAIAVGFGVVTAVVALRTVHRWHTVPGRVVAAIGRSRSSKNPAPTDDPEGPTDSPPPVPEMQAGELPEERPAEATTTVAEPTHAKTGTRPEAAVVESQDDGATRSSHKAAAGPKPTPAPAARGSATSGRRARGRSSTEGGSTSGRHRANGRTLIAGTPAAEPVPPTPAEAAKAATPAKAPEAGAATGHSNSGRGRLTRLIPTQPRREGRGSRAEKSRKA